MAVRALSSPVVFSTIDLVVYVVCLPLPLLCGFVVMLLLPLLHSQTSEVLTGVTPTWNVVPKTYATPLDVTT